MKNEINNTNENISIQQLGYQYEFDIHIISIKIEYKSQFNFKILIKRGNKQNEIDRIFKYHPDLDNEIPINEEFSIVSVLNPIDYSTFDFNKNRVFHDKIYKIYICIYTKTGFKPAISGEINLSNFIDEENEYTLSLSNKTFNEVVIKYRVSSKYISEFDPINLNYKNESDLNNATEISKKNYLSNKENNEKAKNEELMEKKYISTLSTNRTNSIFSNFLKDENKELENSNITDKIGKEFPKNINDLMNNKNVQIINSSNDFSSYELNNTYQSEASKIDENPCIYFVS